MIKLKKILIIIFLPVLPLIWNDPWGVISDADVNLEEIFQAVKSTIYKDNTKLLKDKIIVILISDIDLAFTHLNCQKGSSKRVYVSEMTWPIQYKDYSQITKTLMKAYHAKIVFWDYYFNFRREMDGTYPQMIRQFKKLNKSNKKGNSILIGENISLIPDDYIKYHQKIYYDLERSGVIALPINAYGGYGQYRMSINGVLTPAPFIYFRLIKNRTDVSIEGQNMVVEWPLPDNYWKKFLTEEKVSLPKGIKTYYLSDLCRMDVKKLRKEIGGSIVLIGDADEDIRHVPMYGNLPGVYYHALALYNLLQKDNGYKKSYPPLIKTPWGLRIDKSTLIIISIWIIMTLIFNSAMMKKIMCLKRGGKIKKIYQKLFISFVLIFSVMGAIYLLSSYTGVDIRYLYYVLTVLALLELASFINEECNSSRD